MHISPTMFLVALCFLIFVFNMTTVGKLKKILEGKNKGSNLIILGIFLITLGASYQMLEPINLSSLSIVGNLLVLLGLMAFFTGFLKYILEKN